jgi:hypothetical protein
MYTEGEENTPAPVLKLHRQQIFSIEARIDMREIPDTLEHQTCTDQQH